MSDFSPDGLFTEPRFSDDFELYGDAFPSEGEIFFDGKEDRQKAINFNGTITTGSMEFIRQGFQSGLSIDIPLQLKTTSVPPAIKPSALQFAVAADKLSAAEVTNLLAPAKPLFILPNHFPTIKSLPIIIADVKRLFESDFHKDISYEFDPISCRFEGVYVRGSRFTDFHLNIYEDTKKGGYVIEGQRLNRASCGLTFRSVFDAVKRSLMGLVSPTSTVDVLDAIYGICDPSALEISGDTHASDDEITRSIQVMLSMASDENRDVQFEAARMLCDMGEESSYRQRMAESGCVNALAVLINSDYSLTRQQAIIALAQLSTCQECVAAIIESGIISFLMSPHFGNGSYKTVSYRREAARIIANVSSFRASDVLQTLSREVLQDWVSRIASLEDDDVRTSCERAQASILSKSL